MQPSSHVGGKATATVVCILLAFGIPAVGHALPRPAPDSLRRVTDQGRLYEGTALDVVSPTDEAQLQALVREARRNGWPISIAGKRHSQGGQSFGDRTLRIDMLRYNRVVALDPARRVITVQSGATWKMVQEAANAHRLAPRVMQNSNIFTIGGSISVDAHGPDPREGTIFGTVRSLRLLCPDGSIRRVDREHDTELFRLAVGGYGLFGIILDAEIALTGNAVYRRRTDLMPVSDYPAWFDREVRGNRSVGIHYAWLSIDPRSLLREVYAMSYAEVTPRADSVARLDARPDPGLTRFVFGLSRKWNWAKSLRWTLQKWWGQPGIPEVCTRNDILSPDIGFLDYTGAADSDILQEYFVPAPRLLPFLNAMRKVCTSRGVNLLSATLRYLPASERPFLGYQRDGDAFAVVIYVNVRREAAGKAAAQAWTRELVEAALREGGSYYLVYQLMPSPEQLRRAYPEFDAFVGLKRKYDPDERFSSTFYRHYSGAGAPAGR